MSIESIGWGNPLHDTEFSEYLYAGHTRDEIMFCGYLLQAGFSLAEAEAFARAALVTERTAIDDEWSEQLISQLAFRNGHPEPFATYRMNF